MLSHLNLDMQVHNECMGKIWEVLNEIIPDNTDFQFFDEYRQFNIGDFFQRIEDMQVNLFQMTDENFQSLMPDIMWIINLGPIFKQVFAELLHVYKTVRPKNVTLMKAIIKASQISIPKIDNDIEQLLLDADIPPIQLYTFDEKVQIIKQSIIDDDLKSLQEKISKFPYFDFQKLYTFEDKTRLYFSKYDVSLLDLAAYYGSVKCFKYFMLNDAPVTRYTCSLAISGGNFEIIHLLEQQYSEDYDNRSCTNAAIIFHRFDVFHWLPRHEYFTNSCLSIDSLNFYVWKFGLINEKMLYNNDLHIAIDCCNTGLAYYLCSTFGNIIVKEDMTKATTRMNHNAFYHPLVRCAETGNAFILDTLIEDAGLPATLCGGDGYQAIHEAADRGNLEVAKRLVEQYNVDPDVKEKDYKTPLQFAIRSNHLDVAEYLLSKGANINMQDISGYSLLHTAILYECPKETFDFLFDHKIDTKIRDYSFRTAVEFCEWFFIYDARYGNNYKKILTYFE